MQLATKQSDEQSDVELEVLAGLAGDTKRISPKYFYDQKGSELFAAITAQDEYYVPATERSIIDTHRVEICERIGAQRNVVEPGAGCCEKIRWLLPALDPTVYIPMDISAEHLAVSAQQLRVDYPTLRVEPVACDHSAGFADVDLQRVDDPVFFYPGSSIGNIEPKDVVTFLQSMRTLMDEQGGLLIGVDTKKDPAVLNAAYNDRDGVTADFNLNVLTHLNTLLDGNFEVDQFEHLAFYNEAEGRIEMHLRSLADQSVVLAGETVDFAKGEQVHTENSYKYYPAEFAALAAQAGLQLEGLWQDEQDHFSVMYFGAV